jgi:Ca-activated chloride channel homolog
LNLHIEQPLWIWLAVGTVPLVVMGLAWFRSMAAVRRWSAVVVRASLVALIAALLAGLSSVRTTDTLAVIAVVDVSESVRRFGAPPPTPATDTSSNDDARMPRNYMDAAKDFVLGLAATRQADDLLGVVVFDGAAASVATPTRADLAGRSFDLRLRQGTNIAEALRLARGLIPPDAAARIVLISDGNQTAGDALAAASEASGISVGSGSGSGTMKPVPIDVVPIRYALDQEVSIETLDAPPTAAAGGSVTLRAVISAATQTQGTIIILRDGQPIDLTGPEVEGFGRRVTLEPGQNIEAFEVPLGEGRVHRFSAVFEPDISAVGEPIGDTAPENNTAEAFTVTPGRGSILIIDGAAETDGESSAALASTLREAGLDVTVVQPGGAPDDLLSLQQFDLVILQSVAAELLSARTQESIAAFVRDMGGGLVMIGGPGSFAAGGWRGSILEPLLPVALDLPERLVVPDAAIILVMDNSGSMRRWVLGTGRSQQEIANEAAALAIRSLDPRDLLGVITFNDSYDILIPLARNTDGKASATLMLDVPSGGGTEILSPLEAALGQMRQHAGTAKIRHIILLTDGVSRSKRGLVEIAETMAKENIKLSSIAVGDDTDSTILAEMARKGGGAFYHATQAQMLPKLLLKAVRVVRTPMLREEPFTPVLMPAGSPMTTGIGPDLPSLGGLVLTQPRTEAGVVNAIVTPGGEPVLAHWAVGLGQVVAFTSDAHRWATPWLEWDGYRRFWTQVVRTSSRASAGRGLRGTLASDGQSLTLRTDATDDEGNPLDDLSMTATIYDPAGTPTDVALTAIGPGTYEARIPAAASGSYLALVKPTRAGKPLSPLLLGRSINAGGELRDRTSNTALLEEIARVGSGRVLDINAPESAAVFDRKGITPREALAPLTRLLLTWLIGVLMLDIAVRRIAWDRWLTRAFRPDLAATALREEAARAGRAAASIGGLRATLEAQPTPASADALPTVTTSDSLALGNEDAASLVKAARDRRRAQRLGEMREIETPSATQRVQQVQAEPPTHTDASADGGLLAAKRRALDKFREGDAR